MPVSFQVRCNLGRIFLSAALCFQVSLPAEAWEHPHNQSAHRAAVTALRKLGAVVREDNGGKSCAVRLSQLDVDDSVFTHITRLNKVASLSIEGTKITDRGIEHIKQLQHVRALFLRDNSLLTPACVEHLTSLRKLQVFLLDIPIEDRTLPLFAKLTSLENLLLIQANVTNDGLFALGRIKNLKHLWIVKCPRVSDAGMANLARISSLEFLNFDGTKITDVGLKHLAALPHLRFLNLRRTKISDAGLQYVAPHRELISLNVQQTSVTDAGVKKLQAQLTDCKIYK